MSLKIISNNVRGLRGNEKRLSLFHHFKNINHDFLCLQETHSDQSIENQWSKEWENKIYFSHGTNRSSGVAILVKSGIAPIDVQTDNMGRIIILRVKIGTKIIAIVNIYAPNDEQSQISFFSNLLKMLSALERDEIILCGDFNVCLNIDLDKIGGKSTQKKVLKRSLYY